MLTIKSSVFLKKFQRFFSVLETACQAGHAAPPFSLPSAVGIPSADTAARRWRRLYAQSERVHLPPSAAGECRAHGRGKRGQGHRMVPLPPLDSPKPSFAPRRPSVARRNGGYGGSVPCVGQLLGGLLCPEFPLRYPPRITVRGQTVQGGSVPLRKTPLRSMVYSWSTKRICRPLAFRRATEGSRVLRKGRGVKRGRETLVSLPLLFPPVNTGIPGPPKAAMHTPCHGE